MATKLEQKDGRKPESASLIRPDGFDVTQVIGTVEFDRTAKETPYEAAFSVIADHGQEGTFVFPHEDGRIVSVTVEFI